MDSRQMKTIWKHLYFAGNGFTYRGIHFWTGKRHIRLLALNKFNNWTAKGADDD